MQLETAVIDFGDEAEVRRWASVDDVVMGGVSSSRLTRTDGNTCVFSGIVSLEDGGGFASVRSVTAAIDLAGASAVTLRFRGDGKTYKLRLRTTDAYDGVNYQVSFPTEPGVWAKRTFALADFRPVWRGHPVTGVPPLDAARVCGVGFLISDEQEGAFRLEVASLSKR